MLKGYLYWPLLFKGLEIIKNMKNNERWHTDIMIMYL